MPTVGLVPNPRKPEAQELAKDLVIALSSEGVDALVEAEAGVPGVPEVPGNEMAGRCDILVSLGGDGTLIHAARLCGAREVPILGVNLGTLGYLTEAPRTEAMALLRKAIKRELPVSRRLLLSVEVRRGDRTVYSGFALNEAAISKNAVAQLARLETSVSGKPAAVYEADGLILATPTGSTAWSLSAGGPIVHPSLDAILMVPICPHSLTQRPLVLPSTESISVRLASSSEMFVTLDGAVGCSVEEGDVLRVRTAPHRALLLSNPAVDPFVILRQKLGWGSRAR
ncbi:MAG: NAD(+)/NADH kinase [Deltaproteobacteria bacterium]|nr:NAD(+)/NADH kinase [Deltaproteobacteria bacterium]